MNTTTKIHCMCGAVTGEFCEWTGPGADTVIVEYMPEWLRASHEAAGNAGSYPANGAERFHLELNCADRITHLWVDGEQTDELDPWVRVVN